MAEQAWFSGFREVWRSVTAFLPALVGAALLILAGWLLGRLLAWVARRLVTALLARLAKRPSLQGAIESSGAATQIPRVIGVFVFWVVFVFFLAAAMETLGLPVVTASLSRIAYYLPNVLAALVIVFAGLIAGKLIGNAVTRGAEGAGMALGPAIGGTVRGTVMLIAVVVGAALAGAGLAFGLGARTAVSNIIASHYVAQVYRVGQTVRLADVEGKIVQTTPTAVFVAAPAGRVMIPANRFSEMTSVLLTESER
jgi:hypothetical protein